MVRPSVGWSLLVVAVSAAGVAPPSLSAQSPTAGAESARRDLIAAPRLLSSAFDLSRPLTIEGLVTKTTWVDGRPWIYMDVRNLVTCETEEWVVEVTAPTPVVSELGPKTPLAFGTMLTVDGYQARGGGLRLSGIYLTFSDGRRLRVSSDGDGPSETLPLLLH